MLRTWLAVTGWALCLVLVTFRGTARDREGGCGETPVPPPSAALAPGAPVPMERRAPAPVAEANGADVVRKRARALLEAKEPERALALLEADSSLPEDERALQLGFLYQHLGRPERAIALFEGVLRRKPEQPEVLGALVRAYDHPDRHARGAEFLADLADRRHAGAMGPALAYSDLLARSGKTAEAAGYLLRKAPTLADPAEAQAAAGDLLARSGQLPKATAIFEAAVRSREERLGSSGAPISAVRALRDTRLALVQALVAQSRFDDAERQLRTLGSASPEDLPFTEKMLGQINELRQRSR